MKSAKTQVQNSKLNKTKLTLTTWYFVFASSVPEEMQKMSHSHSTRLASPDILTCPEKNTHLDVECLNNSHKFSSKNS